MRLDNAEKQTEKEQSNGSNNVLMSTLIFGAFRILKHVVLFFTEKVTKYCAELGNWVQIGSTCQPASKNQLEVFGYLLFPFRNVRKRWSKWHPSVYSFSHCLSFIPRRKFPITWSRPPGSPGLMQKPMVLWIKWSVRMKINALKKWGKIHLITNRLTLVSDFDPPPDALTLLINVTCARRELKAWPLLSQGCSAVVTGTGGSAGTTRQREPTPPKAAPIILVTLTPQVSSAYFLSTLAWPIQPFIPFLTVFEVPGFNRTTAVHREGDQVLWRRWWVVSSPSVPSNLDQLYTLHDHPWEETGGKMFLIT